MSIYLKQNGDGTHPNEVVASERITAYFEENGVKIHHIRFEAFGNSETHRSAGIVIRFPNGKEILLSQQNASNGGDSFFVQLG